jgi:hypothetical protein
LNAESDIYGGNVKETLKNSQKPDPNSQLVKNKYKQKRGCQKWQSIQTKNLFFTYMDKNGKNKSDLSLCEIIESNTS